MTRGILLCKILLALEISVLVVKKLCIKEVVNRRPLTRAYSKNRALGVGFCSVLMPRSNIRRAVALPGDVILQIRY